MTTNNEQHTTLLQEAVDVVLTLGLLTSALYIISKKIEHTKFLQTVAKCYDNDYLILEIEGENLGDVNVAEDLLMFRKKELKRLLKQKGVVLVFNNEAARTLKASFSDVEFFKIITTGKTVEYKIDEFVNKFTKYFGTGGEYRSNVNIEGMFKIFKRIDTKSLSQCAKINLVWIGILLRQLVLHGKDLGIEKVRFVSKQVQAVDIGPAAFKR